MVGAGVTFPGQLLERRARRKELLLSKAIDLAIRRNDVGMRFAEKTGKRVILQADLTIAAVYFKHLNHLIDNGDLPPDAKVEAEDSLKAERDYLAV